MATWVVGLIAAAAGLVGVWWQAGGHLAARRRRLNQELDIAKRLPAGTRVRADMEINTLRAARRYLRWSRRPRWRRVALAIVIAVSFAAAAVAYCYFFVNKEGRLIFVGFLGKLGSAMFTWTTLLWSALTLTVLVLLSVIYTALEDRFEIDEWIDEIHNKIDSLGGRLFRESLRADEDRHDSFDEERIRAGLRQAPPADDN